MGMQKQFMCAICGEYSIGKDWFLIVEDSWLDRLKVLHWNETLAGQSQVQQLCSAAHVIELVAHWMVTGSLAYPIASVSSPGQKLTIREGNRSCKSGRALDVQNEGLIGELSVHRESLERALSEHPQCLSTILEALSGALEHVPLQPKVFSVQKEVLAMV